MKLKLPSVAVVDVLPPDNVTVAPESAWPVVRSVTVPVMFVAPVPVRGMAAVYTPALTSSDATRLPTAEGENIISRVQLSPAAIVWFVQVSLVMVKSEEFAPLLLV